ncbi:ankyrin repeat domain-containing protein [Wolbachia endosymbiont of Wuchereria bancrofti]|uniref:ankyrin repeat domain-containing protein n=1 Tax=Wolbachia endosymbiont of Wuchereria bancrofti TaxID=96496 RepID=UPI000B4D44EE|nr:ankyrin repeat domain-containing protein [Wolbachia endosymbiont of Wuchereria bancrofti]
MDQDRWIILYHATNNYHADKVKYLEKGANFEVRDKNEKSSLDLATDKQNNDIVEYLQEKIKSKTGFSKGKSEKAEKRPLFSRITYMNLITTSIAGSIP